MSANIVQPLIAALIICGLFAAVQHPMSLDVWVTIIEAMRKV